MPLRSVLLPVLLIAALAVVPRAAADERPNVLMISIDDLNHWIGAMETHPQVKTPHIDRLAERGTLFTNAHCQSPLCNPSRTSLLVGLRPSTTGIYALNPWFRTVEGFEDRVTLPQHFAAHGYRTLTTGKIWHDAYPPPEGRRDGAEFTVWGYHGGFLPRPPEKFVDTPHPTPLMDWGVFPEDDEEQDEWKAADWAIGQMREASRHREPFFLSVGFRRPHVPCYASQQWFDLYPEEDEIVLPPMRDGERDDVPDFAWYLHWDLPEPRLDWLRESGQLRPKVRAYLATISFVDSQVGRLLDALEEEGLAERTVVVLWSDHGYHLGEKEISGKNTLWEPSTRVPLIFAGPGVAVGGRCAEPVELLDLYPTLAALCGLPARDDLEGRSLLPQLEDDAAPRTHPAITTHGPDNHSVRSRHWRYIRYADGSEELYDHRRDPNEWTNLADDPRYAETKAEHARWLPRSAPPAPGSTHRLIELRDGVPYWEGRPIKVEPDVEP